MTNVTITKARLAANLEAATAEIETLRAQLAAQHAEQAAAPAQAPDLQQTLWLTKAVQRQGQTPTGKLFVEFGGRASKRDKLSGKRLYSPFKSFKAYGEQAAAVLEIYSTDNRLVRISAFESPYLDASGGARSNWIILDVQPVERTNPAPVAPAAPAAAAQPQLFDPDQEVPF